MSPLNSNEKKIWYSPQQELSQALPWQGMQMDPAVILHKLPWQGMQMDPAVILHKMPWEAQLQMPDFFIRQDCLLILFKNETRLSSMAVNRLEHRLSRSVI